jgi:predicted nucleic acid-binding protein
MTVLVDTSVWSLALRKKALTAEESRYVNELRELVTELRVAIIGPIRQELLSGISDSTKFTILKDRLQAFEDLSISQQEFETAAEYSNECRRRGIQGSHTDFLICAVSAAHQMNVFTTDKDFLNYSAVLTIRQHSVREGL